MKTKSIQTAIARYGYVRLLLAVIMVVTVAIIGYKLSSDSRAATPSLGMDPETGVTSGQASIITDTNASSGGAVQFGHVASTFTMASWNTYVQNTAPSLGDSVKTIIANGATVIGLQEVHNADKRSDIRDKILTCTGCHFASNIPEFTNNGSDAHSVAILWDTNKFNLVGTPGYLHVSPDTDCVGDVTAGVVSDKYINWVQLKDYRSGKNFYFLDTHTVASVEALGKPNTNNPCRLKLYATFMADVDSKITELKASGIPIFFAGDFNVNYRYDHTVQDTHFPYYRLNKLGLKSGWETEGALATGLGTHGADDRIIDYVFALTHSAVTVNAMTRINDQLGSDHYPVLMRATVN